MSGEPTPSFDKKVLFSTPSAEVIGYREELFTKFARNMTSLLESQRPKRYSSNRGLLDTRRLYRHQMEDNVFYKKTNVPSSDTTFVFLIDASGSMNASTSVKHNDNWFDRIDVCNAIVSAFAKANKAILNNRIKMEVFTKTEGGVVFDSFVKGYVPMLSRVFSNVHGDTDWDKICGLTTTAPITTGNGQTTGSYTPEFLTLPPLMQWAKKNITTKNMVVVNLTDGDVVHQFIPRESITSYKKNRHAISCYRAYNEDTKALRIKYLRGVPNVTLFLGQGYGDHHENSIKDMYGQNAVCADDHNFDVQLFKTLNRLLNDYA
tara:strand:- start:127 stop:1083 length:957 start_codon:yes stop_codon:yes gene_type:complete